MYCTTCLCCSLCWAGWRRNCSRSQANASDRARCRHLWRGWWPSSQRSLPHPRRWGRQLLFCYSQDDLILSTIILWILSVTCPLSLSFIFFSRMNMHRKKKDFLLYLQLRFKMYQEGVFFSACETWPNNLQWDGTEISCDALLHKETRRRKAGRWGGEEGREARLMWRLFGQAWHCSYIPQRNLPAGGATTETPQRAANCPLGIRCHHSCVGTFENCNLCDWTRAYFHFATLLCRFNQCMISRLISHQSNHYLQPYC